MSSTEDPDEPDGRSVNDMGPDPTPSGKDSETSQTPVWLLLAIPLAIAGLWAGYEIAVSLSRGNGMLNGLYTAFVEFMVAAAVGVLLLVAGLRALTNRGAAGPLATAGVLTAATVAAFLLASRQYPAYHAPVVLTAGGTASGDLTGVPGFVPVQTAAASCSSFPDATSVGIVTADLGELDAGKLGAVAISAELSLRSTPPTIVLYGSGYDLPTNYGMVSWGPAAPQSDLAPGGTSGTATFRAVPFTGGPANADPAKTPPPDWHQPWPATLSGTIHWSCEGWRDPKATLPPDAGGTVELVLDGVDWKAPASLAATCKMQDGGSVGSVHLINGGSLQGRPLSIDVDLSHASGAGGHATVQMTVQAMDLPVPIPNWLGRATVTSAGPGLRSGRLALSTLPTGVGDGAGPAPSGWPTTLTGTLAWACN